MTLAEVSSSTAIRSTGSEQQQQHQDDYVEMGGYGLSPTNDSNENDNDNSPSAAVAAVEEENENEPMEEELKAKRMGCYFKVVFGLMFLGFIIFVIIDASTTGHVKKGIDVVLQWIQNNAVAGLFILVLVYFIATVFFIPGAVLTLGAGFVFSSAFGLGGGVVLGTISVFVGACLGSIAAFLIGRYLLRDQVGKLTKRYSIFEALDAAVENNGLKIFCLLRLSPIVPFNVLNYVAGVTAISLRDYCLALFAMIPGTILWVFLGASAGSLVESGQAGGSNQTVTIVVVVVGAVFGILAIWLTTRYARKELNRVVEKRRLELEEAAAAENESNTGVDEEECVDTEEENAN